MVVMKLITNFMYCFIDITVITINSKH